MITASSQEELKRIIEEQVIAPENARLEIKYKVLSDGSKSYYGAWRENNKFRKYIGHVTGNDIPASSVVKYKKKRAR